MASSILTFVGGLPALADQVAFLSPWNHQRSLTKERFVVMPAPGTVSDVIIATAPSVGRRFGVPYGQCWSPQPAGQGNITTVTHPGSTANTGSPLYNPTDLIEYTVNGVTATWTVRKNGATLLTRTISRTETYPRAGTTAHPPTTIYNAWQMLGMPSGVFLEFRKSPGGSGAFAAGDKISMTVSYTPEWSPETPGPVIAADQPTQVVRVALALNFTEPP